MGPTNIVYNRLLGYKRGVHFDPFKLEFEPEIARQWEVSPDGLTYIVMNDGCERACAELRQRGHRCLATPTDEFIKAGGSVKCLVLMLDAFERWASPGPMGNAGRDISR